MSGIFTSSIGKKLLMSLAGIFLIIFLLVHLGINLLVIIFEDPMVYNKAAHFMSSNILIKIFEIVLFGGFLLHIIYALILQIQNWIARPSRYSKANYSNTSFFSKFMIHTAVITLVFLVIHLWISISKPNLVMRLRFMWMGSCTMILPPKLLINSRCCPL